MAREIFIEKNIESLVVPENLRVAMMVAEQHKKCQSMGWDFDYYGFVFDQSPFHLPNPFMQDMTNHADKGHYSSAQGIPELREAREEVKSFLATALKGE